MAGILSRSSDGTPAKRTYDRRGLRARRTGGARPTAQALLAALKGYNVIAIFHGHQHEVPMIYNSDGLDLFKPKAAYMGGFALVKGTGDSMDVVLGEATDDHGEVKFTNAFSKPIAAQPLRPLREWRRRRPRARCRATRRFANAASAPC